MKKKNLFYLIVLSLLTINQSFAKETQSEVINKIVEAIKSKIKDLPGDYKNSIRLDDLRGKTPEGIDCTVTLAMGNPTKDTSSLYIFGYNLVKDPHTASSSLDVRNNIASIDYDISPNLVRYNSKTVKKGKTDWGWPLPSTVTREDVAIEFADGEIKSVKIDNVITQFSTREAHVNCHL